MDIPASIDPHARKAEALYPALCHAFRQADTMVREGALPLFPEYTDHGPRHITAVIDSARALVAPDSPFSPEDAAALGLAALLHDIAMHLTPDGFLRLIHPDSPWTVKGWKQPPWHALWTSFLLDARRFDQRTMVRLFGRVVPVAEPDADPLLWTEIDRMLAGEFLRRHHPRLAHEIALVGFPGVDGPVPLLPDRFSPKIASLIGHIARSHGTGLRDAVDRLKAVDPAYHRLAFGIQTTFLMALLRLADYMQIQPERAPTGLTRLRRLRSTISQVEWRTHACVEEVADTIDDDPACLLIRATPPDLATYLRLRAWLDGIQAELDQCWVVLGEVHGRFPPSPSLTLRRIKSTIDDLDRLAAEVEYHPQATRFTAADGPLLRLLVGPLYKWDPEIGIRELMQNAIDAVRQRRFLCDQEPDLEALPDDGGVDVDIHVERGPDRVPVAVTVTDRGIGMTAATIRDFFLRAGATYRHGAEWKDRYCDADGTARVERAGRFGVGGLAAFLIGHRITVTTRHAEAGPEGGLTFDAGLEDEVIEIRKAPGPVTIGTTIRVHDLVDAEEFGRDFDFGSGGRREWTLYALPWPRVCLRNGAVVVPQAVTVDQSWRTLEQPFFPEVRVEFRRDQSRLYCSGIEVKDRPPLFGLAPSRRGRPSLSVLDPDGRLELSLDRDTVSGPLPFEPQLLVATLRHRIAAALLHGPDWWQETHGWQFWARIGRDHFLPADPTLLHRAGATSVYAFGGSGFPDGFPSVPAEATAVFIPLPSSYLFSELANWLTPMAAIGLDWPNGDPDIGHLVRSSLTKEERLPSGRVLHSRPGVATDPIVAAWGVGAWDTYLIVQFALDPDPTRASPRFADAWQALVPGLTIPLDEAERRRTLAPLYTELADEIVYWQAWGPVEAGD